MTLSQHQRIFTHHVSLLIMYAYSLGYEITLGEAWRSNEEQTRLFNAKLSQIRSGGPHPDRLAIDFNLWVKGQLTWLWEDYKVLGDYWVKLDPLNVWGGDWNKNGRKDGFIDSPHFERRRK